MWGRGRARKRSVRDDVKEESGSGSQALRSHISQTQGLKLNEEIHLCASVIFLVLSWIQCQGHASDKGIKTVEVSSILYTWNADWLTVFYKPKWPVGPQVEWDKRGLQSGCKQIESTAHHQTQSRLFLQMPFLPLSRAFLLPFLSLSFLISAQVQDITYVWGGPETAESRSNEKVGKTWRNELCSTLRSLRTKMLIPRLSMKIPNQAMLPKTGKMLGGQSEECIVLAIVSYPVSLFFPSGASEQ